MLYDAAQLARVYLHTYQVTGDEFCKLIAAGFALWLCAFACAASGTQVIAIVGERADAQKLLHVVLGKYRPNQVGALASPRPLMQKRSQVDGHETAHVCQHLAYQSPVTEPEPLEAQLSGEPSFSISRRPSLRASGAMRGT
jgi:uncharacterized protein YyaL (SSP411 family)